LTEAEWLACEDARDMMQFLRYFAGGLPVEKRARKYRLFACACVRSAPDLVADEINRTTVALAERLADHQVTADELAAARTAGVTGTVRKTLLRSARMAANDVCRLPRSSTSPAALLRCVFGTPFRPSPTLPPAALAWNDRTVSRLAEAIYEDRKMPEGRFDAARLAILADALLDAGCEDEGLMAHLRSLGPHVRGCWAVDAILGKS
jgi:hypothetical protein